jgi:hypothetical protein
MCRRGFRVFPKDEKMLPSSDRLALASSPEAGPSAPHPEAATCRRLAALPYCVHRRPEGDERPRRSAPHPAAALAGPELGDADVHPRARSLPPALARRARECHAVYQPQGKLHHPHLPHRHRHHQHPPAERHLPPRPHWHPVLVRRNGCCTWEVQLDSSGSSERNGHTHQKRCPSCHALL